MLLCLQVNQLFKAKGVICIYCQGRVIIYFVILLSFSDNGCLGLGIERWKSNVCVMSASAYMSLAQGGCFQCCVRL